MSTKKKVPATTSEVTQYKIQDNVPLPTRIARGKASRFPFDTMKPSQSFMVTLDAEGLADVDKLASRVRSAIYAASRRLNVKFLSEVNEKAGIVTVWRAPEAKA